jgi:putative endonuclease
LVEEAGRRWWVYMLECRDGAIYTGIALDVLERYNAHLAGKGAKYTKMNPPSRILAAKQCTDRTSAAQEEYAIKRMKPAAKREWALEYRFCDVKQPS